jgi:phenylacetate-CoA ligase
VNFLYDAVYPVLPTFAQNWVCSAAGYAHFRSRFNPHFRRKLAEWEQTAHWPLERIVGLQRERLDVLVGRARQHVPHYRDLPEPSTSQDAGSAIAETLAAIRPLEKAEYGLEPTSFLDQSLPRRQLIQGQTSGTTGTCLPLWCTPETLAEEYATVWRMRRSCGVEDPSVPNLTFNGNIVVPFKQTRPPYWRRSAYDNRTLFSIYHMTSANWTAYVDEVHAAPARYVEGYPSAIHLVARALLDAHRPLPPDRVAAVFTSSESLLELQRDDIEKAFGAPVMDRYGVSEKVVSMTACSERRLHVDMEFCIVEVEAIDETDDYVTGPLLVTGLSPHATPMFRYRIGDVGTRSKHPCSCGRPGDVFLDVDGRIEDYVLTPDGRQIGRLDHIFKRQPDVAEAQILQSLPESLDVLIVPRPSYSRSTETKLKREFRARLGDQIQVEIQLCDSIPREANGKFRAVKSQLGRIDT